MTLRACFGCGLTMHLGRCKQYRGLYSNTLVNVDQNPFKACFEILSFFIYMSTGTHNYLKSNLYGFGIRILL